MATVYQAICDTCPFDRTYASQAKADHAFSRHSCAKHLRSAELAKRNQEREASIDRTPKPCLHKVAEHQHGTYSCYTLDHCRCLPCATANSDYDQERVRQQAYGRWTGLVDATPARQYVQSLLDQGMGLKRIVAVSEVSSGALWKLMYGKRRPDGSQTPAKRITPRTEQRILAVQLDLADGAIVDSSSSARRLQALVALGWSMSKLAARLGILPSNFGPIIHGQRGITVANAKAVRALYGELVQLAPPETEWRDKIAASRARGYARQHHWALPVFLGRGTDRRPHPIDDAQFRVLEEETA